MPVKLRHLLYIGFIVPIINSILRIFSAPPSIDNALFGGIISSKEVGKSGGD